MKNLCQCKDGLLYNNFSLIYLQTFIAHKTNIPANEFITPVTEGCIDEQLLVKMVVWLSSCAFLFPCARELWGKS